MSWNPIKSFERAVIRPIGGAIEDAGSQLDDFVNQNIPGGWVTVGALAAGGYLGSEGLLSAAETAGTAEATGATVPSAFDTAVNSALGGGSSLGSFGAVGTGGYMGAVPTAAETAAALTAAGFSPGTAANLAGMTQAGVGAGEAAAGLSATDVLRGLQTAQKLLGGQQPTNTPQQEAAQQFRGVNYDDLLKALKQEAKIAGLLGTKYQPTPLNILNLLG